MKIVGLLIMLLSIKVFSQGKIDGFYRGQGNATLVLGFGYEDSQKYFAGKEQIDLSRNLYYTNLFTAYGITDNFDVQISVPYLKSEDNKAFQDISVFSKYRFYKFQTEQGNFQISVGAGFSTPLSDYAIGGLYDLGQQATVIDTRLMVHYQCSTNWFATLQSGLSFKFEEVPNSLPVGLKIGKASSKIYYDAFYEYQHSFGGDDYLGSPRPQNFREFGVDYHKVGGTIFTHLAQNLGIYVSYSYLISGRNVFQGPSYGAGLTYDFKRKE